MIINEKNAAQRNQVIKKSVLAKKVVEQKQAAAPQPMNA